MTTSPKLRMTILIVLAVAFMLMACGGDGDDTAECKPVKITTCSKFEDGDIVDSYTREGSRCQGCRTGYQQSCHDGCE